MYAKCQPAGASKRNTAALGFQFNCSSGGWLQCCSLLTFSDQPSASTSPYSVLLGHSDPVQRVATSRLSWTMAAGHNEVSRWRCLTSHCSLIPWLSCHESWPLPGGTGLITPGKIDLKCIIKNTRAGLFVKPCVLQNWNIKFYNWLMVAVAGSGGQQPGREETWH